MPCASAWRGTDKIFLSAAKGAGNPVVYIGSKTGRDGIHGATMASAEFDDASEEKRPTVQVGDPFTEKLLLEACLELMATDAIIAIQDMGAAGLTSSSAEMGDKGGSGIELDLDKVPQREANMTAYEMMLSESQERMLAVLKPGREAQAEAIFKKWELDFAVIGITTDTNRLVVKHKGEVVADMPITALSDAAPVYERPYTERKPLTGEPAYDKTKPVLASLKTILASPDMASRRWVWEQYDHTVMADTVQVPGGDAAVVRVHGTQQGAGHHHRCDAALLPARSVRRRQAGGGRSLAQPDRGGRDAAGRHRQSELRQSAKARDHVGDRGRHRRHRRRLPGAGFPGDRRQLLALQRDQWRRHPAHPRHRRRRPDEGRHQDGHRGVQARGRCRSS